MDSEDGDKPSTINLFDAKSRLKFKTCEPLLSSQKLGWKRLNLDCFPYNNCETPTHILEHHAIELMVDSGIVERRLDGKYRKETTTIGSVAIIPAQVEHWSARSGKGRYIVLAISLQAIANIDPDIVNPDLVELIPSFAQAEPDYLIYGIGTTIERYLTTHSGREDFYIEHLTNAISAHLIKNYSTQPIRFKNYSGGLSSIKLKQAIEYINNHLAGKIQLQDIARELEISQYYFSRLFRKSIGISPHRYIIQKRIEKVKQLLTNTQLPLAEIALECGFSSQSQMTMHFKKLTGTTPNKYRNF